MFGDHHEALQMVSIGSNTPNGARAVDRRKSSSLEKYYQMMKLDSSWGLGIGYGLPFPPPKVGLRVLLSNMIPRHGSGPLDCCTAIPLAIYLVSETENLALEYVCTCKV